MVAAAPLYATFNLWRCPAYPPDRATGIDLGRRRPRRGRSSRWLLGARLPRPLQRRELFVIGIDLDRNPFSRRSATGSRRPGRSSGSGTGSCFNEHSHPDFGWQLRDRFKRLGARQAGRRGRRRLPHAPRLRRRRRVICSDENFVRLCAFPRPRPMNFGFLKVRPGTAGATRPGGSGAAPPDDVQPSRASEILRREIDHWVNQTSTGKLFAFGVLVAMIVAAVVVYQVLSNDVREHLPEYATLKAMGYSLRRLAVVVVAQSIIYMLISYVIAVVLGLVVYRATEELAGIPMRLTSAEPG